MIHLDHPKWRALRVSDATSVRYLNRLLREGWFVVPFDMDDIEYFVMRVPTETPPTSRYPVTHDVSPAQKVPAITVVVLTKGTLKGRQRAMLLSRDEAWMPTRAELLPSESTWTPIIRAMVEEGMLTVFERRADP